MPINKIIQNIFALTRHNCTFRKLIAIKSDAPLDFSLWVSEKRNI
jgi:hypothetical protein